MLRFDSNKGLYADDESVVRDDVQTNWKNAFKGDGLPELDTAAETPAGQLIDSQTAAIASKDAELLYLTNQFNPTVAEGRWQDALAKIYLLDRQVAQPTIVTCVCSGLPNTTIPKGALVKSTDNIILSAVNEAIIGQNGVVSVIFATQNVSVVDISANTVTSIVTVIPGWDTVNNPTAGVTGRFMETRAEFERRRLASVANNGEGSVASIYGNIANINRVVAAVVLENDSNIAVTKYNLNLTPHSILASIYGGDDSKIAEAIYRKKNAGCATNGNTTVSYSDPNFGELVSTYKIYRPTPTAFGVRVILTLTVGTPSNIEELIKAAVLDNFNGNVVGKPRVSMASTIYGSRFTASIEAVGVLELVSVDVSIPAGVAWSPYVTVGADIMPVLSLDDIIVLPVGG